MEMILGTICLIKENKLTTSELKNLVIGICVFHVVLDEAQINFFAINH